MADQQALIDRLRARLREAHSTTIDRTKGWLDPKACRSCTPAEDIWVVECECGWFAYHKTREEAEAAVLAHWKELEIADETA